MHVAYETFFSWTILVYFIHTMIDAYLLSKSNLISSLELTNILTNKYYQMLKIMSEKDKVKDKDSQPGKDRQI